LDGRQRRHQDRFALVVAGMLALIRAVGTGAEGFEKDANGGPAGVQAATAEVLLDVSGFPPPRSMFGRPRPQFELDRSSPAWPLRVTLATLDRPDYRLGTRVLFDVVLEPATSLALPWTAECQRVDPELNGKAPGYRAMSLALIDLENGTAASQTLCGSSLDSQSLRTVKAGERVRVRIGDNWRLEGGSAPLKVTLAVFAQFRQGEKILQAIKRSENTMPVNVLP
jgi:hypothetical protein